MAKTPCAVFWDIQNIGVPKGQSAASVVSLIRSSIINLYNLKEIYFYCVCDVTKLPANVGNPLTNQDVNIIQAYDYTKDSADIKILDLMRKFVENQGRQGCAIILLSGDGDYAGTLIDLKKLYNITIFVIRLATSFSVKLEQAANYAFKLAGGQLQPIRSSGTPQYFVSFSRFPISRGMKAIKLDLIGMTQPYGSIDKSAIDHDDEVIIGFPSLELANRAVTRLNTARYYGTFLKAEILQDPPSEIIIKVQNACSSVAPTPKPPVKKVPALEQKKLPDNQITFIKISQLTTDLLSEDELTHHFAKLTIPYESKYVKFHQSAIWIAFTNSNHAQECLNKLKSTLLLGKPVIAAITTPPLDLLSSSMRQELSVSSKPSSPITTSPQSTSSSSSSSPSNSGNPLKNIPSSNLDDHHSSDRTILAQLQGDNCLMKSSTKSQGVNQNFYICLTSYSESTFQTKWSLTYKILFEIRDYHPKKLFIEDDTVWLWFTNEINHSQALTQLNSEFIKSVMKVDSTASSKINLSELVSSYCDSNPWCFTSDFELYFLKVDAIENFTDEIEKEIRQTVKETQVDHKLNCIFLKLNGGSIWAAFPDLMCCLDAEFLISTHQQIRSSIKLTWTKAPPIELLQSIGLEDLIGDARSLAELLATPVQSDESNNNDSSVDDTSVEPMVTQADDDPEMKIQLLESESPLDEHQSSIEVKKTDEVDTLLELQSMNINASSPTQFKNTFICLMGAPNATFPTHWSLFVFIVKKFIFMGLKKVILVNEIFWCKFESESDCQTVFKKVESNQMNLLPLIHVSTTPQPTDNLTGQLAFHQSCNPLCITSELRLHYLKCTLLDPVTNSSTVDEMVNDVKKLLTVASKVIFVKADQYNTIWAGFPSGRTCDAAIFTIYKRNTWKIRVDLLHFKQAPLALLPLIQTQDLYGEALELSQRWMEHVKQSSSKLNSIITLSSSSSSLSSTSPKENKPARSGSQFVGQTIVPKVLVMKSGENVTQSTKKSRARKRGRAPRTSSSVANSPSKQPIVAFATLNSNSIQFANIRNKFICLNGVTNAEFTTFWSLLYNIVAQTVGHRIYKVIMEGSNFWLYFDSENQCQEVIKKINQDSNFIKSMKMKKSVSPSKKLLATISSYHPDGPWCFTLSLGLNYLKSTYQDPKEAVNSSATAQSLVNIIKSVSNEFKCIFVKFHEGTVWAAFPSIRTCDNAKKTLNATIVGPVFMQTVHPRQLPDNLLESIGTSDLIGDALTLSQQWFEMRNAPSNYSPRSSDENNLSPQINFITTSMSIDSDTDSNSVISDHVNTDRYYNQKLYSSDGEGGTPPIPETTYMVNRVFSAGGGGGQDVFLTIGDVIKIPRVGSMNRWKKQKIIVLVDFINIPPRAACLDNDVVHFHYNTMEEAARAKRFIESNLYQDRIQLTAAISNDAPACWSVNQKSYFSLPRTLPAPARRLATHIIISPLSKRAKGLLNNPLLAALQPFYVYFIRHFEEALWIGIGSHEQAEAAITAFAEQKLLNDTLNAKIEKRLPKDFWKIIRGEIKPTFTNDSTTLPASKASSVNGSTSQLNHHQPVNKTATVKVSTSTLSQTATGVSSTSPSNQVATQQSNGKTKTSNSPVFVFAGGKSNGTSENLPITFMAPDSPKYPQSPIATSSPPRTEPGPRSAYRGGYLTDSLPNNGSIPTLTKSTTSTNSTNNISETQSTSSTKPNNDASSNDSTNRSLSKEITTILTNPSTTYLLVTAYPVTVMTKEAVSHIKGKLMKHGCLFVTKLPDSICSGFYSSEKRNQALREIVGSNYTDIFGHNYTFLTRFVYTPPLNLLSILKTSDLTLSSDYYSTVKSQSSSYFSNNLTRPTAVATSYHPLSTSPFKISLANHQTFGQSVNNSTTPNTSNGKLENSSKKSTKKSKSGGCFIS